MQTSLPSLPLHPPVHGPVKSGILRLKRKASVSGAALALDNVDIHPNGTMSAALTSILESKMRNRAYAFVEHTQKWTLVVYKDLSALIYTKDGIRRTVLPLPLSIPRDIIVDGRHRTLDVNDWADLAESPSLTLEQAFAIKDQLQKDILWWVNIGTSLKVTPFGHREGFTLAWFRPISRLDATHSVPQDESPYHRLTHMLDALCALAPAKKAPLSYVGAQVDATGALSKPGFHSPYPWWQERITALNAAFNPQDLGLLPHHLINQAFLYDSPGAWRPYAFKAISLPTQAPPLSAHEKMEATDHATHLLSLVS